MRKQNNSVSLYTFFHWLNIISSITQLVKLKIIMLFPSEPIRITINFVENCCAKRQNIDFEKAGVYFR